MKLLKKIKSLYNDFIFDNCGNQGRARLLKKCKGVSIGKGGEIYKGVSFGSEPYLVTLGDNVRITTGVKFCTHDGGMWVIRNLGYNNEADLFGKISVGNNVHIGWDTIIMPNVSIGDNVIIGCGSIVTHDIPDNCVAVGSPARVIKTIDEYYEKNRPMIVCTKGLQLEEKKKMLLGGVGK